MLRPRPLGWGGYVEGILEEEGSIPVGVGDHIDHRSVEEVGEDNILGLEADILFDPCRLNRLRMFAGNENVVKGKEAMEKLSA